MKESCVVLYCLAFFFSLLKEVRSEVGGGMERKMLERNILIVRRFMEYLLCVMFDLGYKERRF